MFALCTFTKYLTNIIGIDRPPFGPEKLISIILRLLRSSGPSCVLERENDATFFHRAALTRYLSSLSLSYQ